jgi:UDP:flavonoid glycosyltransferase YjiC (YdhE family)
MSAYNTLIDVSTMKRGTKILFANVPADGHFNPLTSLAVHLKNLGCDVRWYTSDTYREKIERLGIPHYPLQKAFDISANIDLDDKFPERKKQKGQVARLKFDMINVFILRSPEYYEDIKEIHKEFPFQLMIADITFGGIPFVKEKMNIPVIAISIVPLPETSKDLPPSGLGMTPSYSLLGKIKQSVLRFVADVVLFKEPTKVMREILLDHGIDPGNYGIFDILIQKSTVVLQSGTPGFEYNRSDLSNHVLFAGGILPYNKKKITTRWYSEKLKQYDKVILVTQGTVEKDVHKLLIPTLEAFKNTDTLVVVTTGGSQTQYLRNQYPEQNIIIEDFIPFDDVLPYTDVYVSNGGYGGVLMSIGNGVPMVVGGVHEGKNEINARVGYFNLGINLKTEKPTTIQVKEAVKKVLASDLYRRNVSRLQEEFKRYRAEEICAKQVARLLAPKMKPVVVEEEQEHLIY